MFKVIELDKSSIIAIAEALGDATRKYDKTKDKGDTFMYLWRSNKALYELFKYIDVGMKDPHVTITEGKNKGGAGENGET